MIEANTTIDRRQLAHVDAEVGLRRGLHAVSATTQIDGVQVVLEDLVLDSFYRS